MLPEWILGYSALTYCFRIAVSQMFETNVNPSGISETLSYIFAPSDILGLSITHHRIATM